MSIRRNIAVAGLVAIALVAVVIYWCLPPPEPVYLGKPLSAWLKSMDGGIITNTTQMVSTQGAREDAMDAVRQMGTNAIPPLMRMLREKDSPLMVKLLALAQKQRFVKITYTTPAVRRRRACAGLTALHRTAKDVVPELIEMFDKDRSAQASLLAAVGEIGEPGELIPVLLKAVDSTNQQVRLHALVLACHFRIGANPVMPVLIKALRMSPDPWDRSMAAEKLGSFGTNAQAAVPALVECLHDTDAGVRTQAREALRNIDARAAAKAGIEPQPAAKSRVNVYE